MYPGRWCWLAGGRCWSGSRPSAPGGSSPSPSARRGWPSRVPSRRSPTRSLRRRSFWSSRGAGAAVRGLIPLTNRAALGDWRATPWSVYAKEYMPWDRLGFGFDATPPARTLPEDMRVFSKFFEPVYGEHVAARLPQTFVERSQATLNDMFGGRRKIMIPFALIGL